MKFLSQDGLEEFLAYLARDARVLAPVKTEGVVQYQEWEPGVAVELDVLLAKQSPKEFVFPQSETCLRFHYTMAEGEEEAPSPAGVSTEPAQAELEVSEGGEPAQPPTVLARETLVVDSDPPAPPQVVFGLRPCDARGFVQMDNVFGGYGGFYFDPFYNSRREATALVAVTCRDPRSTCFCTAIGGNPAGTEGVDVLLTQVEGGFAAEAVTPKGEGLLAFEGFVEAEAGKAEAAQAVKESAAERIEAPFSLEAVKEALPKGLEDPRWHDLAMRCISCGTCTYVCPNCYCFNIMDELVETKGERYRAWDNCFNPSYTLETSGHNARDAKASRFRNRFSHKFWYYPEKYDSLLCSGCGRCVMHCPTRIDIREVLSTIATARPQQAGEGA
jgi:ferredoxin